MKRLEAVNDFVVKFANVNGSGSASANELFAKAILRMGVPVSPRNIFPSNIQGLPTWYEVRVSEKGWLGRRGGIDMMVAMNPQTWEQDVAEIEPGGYLFYDSTKPLPTSAFRDDMHVIGMPLTAICNATYEDPRQRQLFKNIMYIGALSVLLDIDATVIEKLFAEQYRGKERLLESNVRALHAGREFARDHLDPIGLRVRCSKRRRRAHLHRRQQRRGARLRVRRRDGVRVVSDHAVVVAAPRRSRSTASKYRVDQATGANNYAIVQAEDEIASIGIVIGAGWNGARAFTATSGPGVSLMTEFIGLAYFAEIPMTIIDVQRGGPSTGMPTRTQQADLLACAYASHGDTKHVLLFPEDPNECFEHAAAALDLADRLQTPVFVMTDLDIGMNQRLCAPFEWDDERRYDRGKVMTAEELEAGRDFGRYKDVDGDGIPWRTLPGTHPSKGAYFTRGTTRDAYARYSERARTTSTTCSGCCGSSRPPRRWCRSRVVRAAAQPTRLGVIYFGSTSPAMGEALDALGDAGIHLDAMRLRAFPFPASVAQFIADHDAVFVVEQNRDAQMRVAADQRVRDRPGAADAGAALRRHADHRALHHPGDHETGARDRGEAAGQASEGEGHMIRHASSSLSRLRERVGLRAACALEPSPQPSPWQGEGEEVMTYLAKPKLRHPTLATNKVGYTRRDYEGKISTLCAGCGHDSISAAIMQACWELDIEPHRVAKLSGIGCSSKTPDYFLGASHGFNTVHGRMPSVLTGANLANRDLLYLGVSGDGDSASIGLGQFAHAMRRGVNMVYIVENNGVYGLDQGPVLGDRRPGLEVEEGRGQRRQPDRPGRARAAARRDLRRAQLLGRQGAARAADQGRDRAPRRRVHRRHQPVRRVQQPRRQHAQLRLRARAQRSGEPHRLHHAARNDHGRLPARRADRGRAARRQRAAPAQAARRLRPARPRRGDAHVQAMQARGEVVTGLLYVDPSAGDLHDALNTSAQPLNALREPVLCPGAAALEKLNAGLR